MQRVEARADEARTEAPARWATRLERVPWRWVATVADTVTRSRSRGQRWVIGVVVGVVLIVGFVISSIVYTYYNAWSDCMRLAPETARVLEPTVQWEGIVCTFADQDGQVVDTRILPWIGKAAGT